MNGVGIIETLYYLCDRFRLSDETHRAIVIREGECDIIPTSYTRYVAEMRHNRTEE